MSYQFLFFIASLFLAAIAGPGSFGTISLMIVNAAAFIIVTDFGTGAALVWFGAGNEVQPSQIFSYAAWSALAQLSLFLIAELLAATFSGHTLLSRQSTTPYHFLFESVYFGGLVLTEKYTSLFYGRNKASLANKTLSFVAGIFLIYLILVYAKLLPAVNPLVVFSCMFLLFGVSEAIIFHGWVQRISFGKLDGGEVKSMVSFSAVVFITNLIQFFAYRIDFWLVDRFYSNSELGIYAQANRFAQLVWIIPIIVAALMTPAIRSRVNSLNDDTFLAIVRVLNLINVGIVACTILISLCFYYWLFQPDYRSGLPALLLMLPGYLFFSITTLLAAWFAAKRKLALNLGGSSLCFVAILTADLILIPRYSLIGAGIANSIAYSITTIYFIVQFRKQANVKLRDLIVIRKQDIFILKNIMS